MSKPSAVTPALYRFNFALLVALLLVNGGFSYKANRELIHNESRIQKTQGILAAIKDTFSALQDAETGQRGYLITEDPEYLEPYERAAQEIRSRRAALDGLDSEIPEQTESIEEFGQLIDLKMQELETVVELVKQREEKEATRILETDRGNDLMTRIRALVDTMEEREYALMKEQRDVAAASREKVLRSIHVATLAGLFFLSVAFYLVQRAIRTERENVEKLTLTNEELEKIVEERTIAIEQYSKELQRSNRELEDFAFVASHDLQEPLRKIRAFGDRLQTKHADSLGDGADYIDRMQSAAERMSRLINDLLAFSRVTTKARPFEPTDLTQVLSSVLEDLSERIEETDATVTTEPLPEIEADPTQMRQLFQNLIGNALKFVDEGQAPVVHISGLTTVDPEDTAKRTWHVITVRDNGIGFDSQFADRIFTPFQRLHTRDAYSGTGIGLAVCRRVVERHGGRIKVSSSPGDGSRFDVYLPQTQQSKLPLIAEGSHEAE